MSVQIYLQEHLCKPSEGRGVDLLSINDFKLCTGNDPEPVQVEYLVMEFYIKNVHIDGKRMHAKLWMYVFVICVNVSLYFLRTLKNYFFSGNVTGFTIKIIFHTMISTTHEWESVYNM